MSYNLQFGVLTDAIPDLLIGAALSLSLAVTTMAAGIVVAAPLAIGSSQKRGVFAAFARTWIELARNTPCLLQIYVFYYGLGAFQIFLPAWLAVLIALFFNNAGYLAEIFRGGLATVSPNQFKAGQSLGFGSFDVYRYIVFPQVFEKTYNSITNQFVWALLNTSLGALVGLYDLSGVAMDYQSRTFRTFEFFICIAVLYLVMTRLVLFVARSIIAVRKG